MVASVAAALLARTAPLAALTFWVIVVAGLVLLNFREHHLDQGISRLEQQIAELVGYR